LAWAPTIVAEISTTTIEEERGIGVSKQASKQKEDEEREGQGATLAG